MYVYDGNGDLLSKTDGDGYVTEYPYDPLDLVASINYNGAKEVNYQYNKVGELVRMDDRLGTTTFELDLLNRLSSVAHSHKYYPGKGKIYAHLGGGINETWAVEARYEY